MSNDAAGVTPGPWKVHERECGGAALTPEIRATHEGKTVQICMMEDPVYPTDDPFDPFDIGVRVGSIEANARLIAAAPDLLRAAQKISEFRSYPERIGGIDLFWRTMREITDAVKRATGETE